MTVSSRTRQDKNLNVRLHLVMLRQILGCLVSQERAKTTMQNFCNEIEWCPDPTRSAHVSALARHIIYSMLCIYIFPERCSLTVQTVHLSLCEQQRAATSR